MDKAHLTADALCDFAEGLMSPADRRAAEAHLALCAECRREAAAMQGYFREMSGLETLKAPDRFLTKVHARIAKASPWRRLLAALSSPRLLPVPLMGLAVLLVGVYFLFLSPRLAEQLPAEPVAVISPPAPEPAVRLPKQRRQHEAPAAASPEVGTTADIAPEPPPQVAMAPAKSAPRAARAPKAEESIARLAKGNPVEPSDPVAVGKAASARPRADVAAAETPGIETQALAFAEAGRAAEGRQEAKAKDQSPDPGPGVKAGSKERKQEEAVGWMDNPSAEAAPLDKVAAIATGESDIREMVQLESDDEEGYAAPVVSARKRSAPAAAPPATTPKPWAPLAYTLKAKAADRSFRNGLAKLGVKVIRQDESTGRRYELEVPATRVIDLEAYLQGLGTLTPSPQPLPGKKDGAPLYLTLKIVPP